MLIRFEWCLAVHSRYRPRLRQAWPSTHQGEMGMWQSSRGLTMGPLFICTYLASGLRQTAVEAWAGGWLVAWSASYVTTFTLPPLCYLQGCS